MAPKGFDPLSSKDVELEKTLATFVASSLKINTSEKMATFVVFDHVCGRPRLWHPLYMQKSSRIQVCLALFCSHVSLST